MSNGGRVYLIGAGPGDPELITARGIRRLAEADLVLYDALIHPEVLRHAGPQAETVFVGKRAGRASVRQTRINEQMIAAAKAGRIVARVKGGDPYLFGRGSEEAEALAQAGIPFEVVPGVPSPLAATAYTGISLTHRTLASSVAYVTATESPEKDRTSHDWPKLATATESLVIFMGLRKLRTLTELLVQHGRSPDTPAAVIQSASLPRQQIVVGTVADIADRAEAAGLGMPSLTVIGPVVELRSALRWYDRQPLFGRRAMITRPIHQSSVMTQLLRDRGAEPVIAPTIRIVPPADPKPLRRAIAHLQDYDWVVFTSANGVEHFFTELRQQGGDARRLGDAKVAAIGPATARALRSAGIEPDRVPPEYRGEAVAEAIVRPEGANLRGRRILLPRAAVAREVLPETLRRAGGQVDVVAAYQSVPPEPEDQQRVRRLIEHAEVDAVLFTSSSTVRHLVDLLGARATQLLEPITLASIGPITTQTATELGLEVAATAEDYTREGVVEALVAHYESRS